MQKGLAVTISAAVLALASKLALAAPLAIALPAIHAPVPAASAAAGRAPSSAASQSGIRPAVLEIAIPNSVHRALAHPAAAQDLAAPAAQSVQWLTGPVPSRCQHSSGAASSTHACLVI